jgi:hypothetical protein
MPGAFAHRLRVQAMAASNRRVGRSDQFTLTTTYWLPEAW